MVDRTCQSAVESNGQGGRTGGGRRCRIGRRQPRNPSRRAFTTFGDCLRFLRRRARLTQRELAIAVGYSPEHISRSGEQRPSPGPGHRPGPLRTGPAPDQRTAPARIPAAAQSRAAGARRERGTLAARGSPATDDDTAGRSERGARTDSCPAGPPRLPTAVPDRARRHRQDSVWPSRRRPGSSSPTVSSGCRWSRSPDARADPGRAARSARAVAASGRDQLRGRPRVAGDLGQRRAPRPRPRP